MTDVIRSPVLNNFRITDAFGVNRGSYVHLGTDFGPVTRGVAGDPLVAVADGTLVYQYTSKSDLENG